MDANAAPLIAETLFPALARAVVVSPQSLEIDVKHATASSTVCISSNHENGNLIGKHGNTYKSFQLVAKLSGAKHRWPITYSVPVPPGENPPPADRPRIPIQYRFDADATAALLRSTLSSFLTLSADVTSSELNRHTGYEIVLSNDEPVPDAEMFYNFPESISPGKMPVNVKHRVTGDDAVAVALSVIFAAVGRIGGMKVVTTLIRRVPAPDATQPATAAGRYAKEVK